MKMVINKTGIIVLAAEEEFDKEIAPKLGLRNVFKLKREYISSKFQQVNEEIEILGTKIKTINYKEVETELECPSDEEINNYVRLRDEYVAEQVLKEVGWNEFVKRCRSDNIEYYIAEHTPCEGPNGQCNMFCHNYNGGCRNSEF